MDSARQAKDREEQQQAASAVPIPGNEIAEPSVNAALAAVPCCSLGHDDQDDDDEASIAQVYDLVTKVHPPGGEHLVQHPTTQHVRRKCHNCETPFASPTQTECEQCHHTKCEKRPPTLHNADRIVSLDKEQIPKEEARTVPEVQRVYRKARQRIRYTCDHCDAVFVDRYTC
ncbi:hypothetical protein B0A55_11891 [Friedmanniomyces simplex]|uniref:Uncharacterized protein n=1 Tax=Friedmanniomyces simplex TaxID=329884 RepID=A0A4U0WJ87_9PEZI|nr:hypothetical protein B0A55_11891 [Friedmanniomyces simplex]